MHLWRRKEIALIWHRLRHYAGLWGFSRRIILQQLLSVAYSALMLSISWFFYRLLRLNCIYISNCYTILLEVVINEWLQSDKKHCLNHFINQAIKKQNKKWIRIEIAIRGKFFSFYLALNTQLNYWIYNDSSIYAENNQISTKKLYFRLSWESCS